MLNTKKKNFIRFISFLLSISALSVLIFFLYDRFQMAFTQHFDLDEFAYLHWTSHIVMGAEPFRNFYFFMPPGYLWFLLPAFKFFPPLTLQPIFAARVLEFGAFTLLAVSSGWLFWEMRRSWLAILVPLIIVFLPLPSIKFVEIRPDTLSMAFVVLGMIFGIKFIKTGNKYWAFYTGLFYGLSLFVTTKVIAAVVAGVAVITLGALKDAKIKRHLINVYFGIAAIVLIGAAWLLYIGGWEMLNVAFYWIIKAPLETSSRLGKLFPIPVNMFFYPNAFFYGSGSDIGLYANHAIWLIGFLVATFRIVTVLLPRGRKEILSELLIAVTFISQLLFFIYGSTHHSQYLIPLVMWAAWYFVDGTYLLWSKVINNSFTVTLFAIAFLACILVLNRVNNFVNGTRLVYPMKITFDLLTEIWKKIPTNEKIFDLEGGTLYYPDPYYACCLPFGQTQQYLSRPLSSLSAVLEETKTKYVYQGESKRLNTLTSADQAYILEKFEPWENHEELLVRK